VKSDPFLVPVTGKADADKLCRDADSRGLLRKDGGIEGERKAAIDASIKHTQADVRAAFIDAEAYGTLAGTFTGLAEGDLLDAEGPVSDAATMPSGPSSCSAAEIKAAMDQRSDPEFSRVVFCVSGQGTSVVIMGKDLAGSHWMMADINGSITTLRKT